MMTLGEVIHELRKAKPDAQVFFDFAHCVPTVVASWRGIYAEPALGWESSKYNGNVKEYPTASSLIAELEAAIDGRTYCGWKGGEFSYSDASPLHIDNQGDYTNTEIRRIEINDWRVLLHTATEE